jgi:small subunit ribosomal protein S10
MVTKEIEKEISDGILEGIVEETTGEEVDQEINQAQEEKPKLKKLSAVAKKILNASSKDASGKDGRENKVVLRIKIKAYENKILDASVKQIIDTATRYDATIIGPVPLPTEIKKYTVNRASFVYKNSREQFEVRIHKRLIDIINPNAKIIEALTNLSLPSGVDIDVKML